VYRAAGGSETVRVFTMNAITVGFFAQMAFQMSVSLLLDPATYERGNLARSLRRFRTTPLMRRSLWEKLRDYNRAGFHPNDHDTTALVEHWQRELFGDAGYPSASGAGTP